MAAQNIPLTYKGHPLRRKDSLIYYGSMAQKYIIMLQILSQKKDQDLDVATKVSVQLQLTDPDLKSRDRVVKKTEKDSLYAAMDVASVWLEREDSPPSFPLLQPLRADSASTTDRERAPNRFKFIIKLRVPFQ